MALHEWTIVQARRALTRGELRCTEYVEALLAQKRRQAKLNALVSDDDEALLAAARAADDAGAVRDAARPLAGIPLALKDNIDTVALSTSAGTAALRGRTPPANAPVAQRLFDAGALLMGKANMHELAFGITTNNAVTGATRNPWDPRMIPGGSSGGSAAAVGGRIVPAAIGTDTGASVRVPAALCGVVGLRPTVGRYPGKGIVPISHTRDTPGPMARSVADIALLDAVMAADARSLATLELGGIRLGVPRLCFYDGADAEVLARVEESLQLLRKAGVELVEAEVEELDALNAAVGFPVALYELTQDLPAYLRECGYELTMADVAAAAGSPDVAEILAGQLGETGVTRAAYEEALRVRPRLQAAFAGYFSKNRLDAMIFPTSILPARPIGEDATVELNGERVPTFATYIRNSDPGSNAGIPGISIPVGLTGAGLPVGVELSARAGDDRRLIALAAAVERVLPPMPAPGAGEHSASLPHGGRVG
jgi:mandelamide amidase